MVSRASVPFDASRRPHLCAALLTCVALHATVHDVIRSFRHRGLKKFFEAGDTSGISPSHSKRIAARLDIMDGATVITQLDVQGFNLHQLKGEHKGIWSIHVNGPWCITFRFQAGDCHDVDYEQYH